MSSDSSATISAAMADRAGELLASLDAAQHAAATWPVPDPERRTWFYTPTDHGGLPLSEMNTRQHRLVWRLVATGLSEAGFNTATTIVGQENVLDRLEGFGVDFGRERGRDPMLYWVAIFGDPESDDTWGWRFAGHHLSLNFTISAGRVTSATPCFMGADPASAPLLGPHLHRPLAAVEDLGRELARSLSATQRPLALLASSPPPDLIGVNRTTLSEGDTSLPLALLWRGRFEAELEEVLGVWQSDLEASLGGSPEELARLAFSTTPKGIPISDLTADQREVFDALMLTYIGRIDDNLADEQLARVRDAESDLRFLWAGSLEEANPHYYRIQGGDLFIEYDNAQRGGNHVHTVWRDLAHDFGGDPLADHYTHGHTH